MKLIKAIRLAEDCGLSTIRQAYANVELNVDHFFVSQSIDHELNELMLDIKKLSIEYGITEDELLNWKIKEYKLYAQ